MNNNNPQFLQVRFHFRTGLVKDLYIESTGNANDSWEYLVEKLGNLETLYVSSNMMTRGWWIRVSEIIFIERIG